MTDRAETLWVCPMMPSPEVQTVACVWLAAFSCMASVLPYSYMANRSPDEPPGLWVFFQLFICMLCLVLLLRR